MDHCDLIGSCLDRRCIDADPSEIFPIDGKSPLSVAAIVGIAIGGAVLCTF